MTTPDALRSGKTHRDENFPVASLIIHPRHREAILAFYRFARTADDVADNPSASPAEKLKLLDSMAASLTGENDAVAESVRLRGLLLARRLTAQHAFDLLEAFRRDVTKLRYKSWSELMDYCRYSAMPVGRFVLDVHGETSDSWPYNDALCAALQVINHLQDCRKDYRQLNRVYLPLEDLKAARIGPEVLDHPFAPPALLAVIRILAARAVGLLEESRPFADRVRDLRLGLEIDVIRTLAENLNRRLMTRDPLHDRVHHTKSEAAALAVVATTRFAGRRLFSRGGSSSMVRQR